MWDPVGLSPVLCPFPRSSKPAAGVLGVYAQSTGGLSDGFLLQGLILKGVEMTRTAVLGLGALGCHMAWHAVQRGWDVTVIDRNGPFERNPVRQTSNAAIGIIEPFGLKPRALCQDWYLRSRQRYQELISAGHNFVSEIATRYYSNEEGFLDGPDGRAEEEHWRKINPGRFRFAEEFVAILVNTSLYNDWIRRQLIELGVRFEQREIDCDPGEVTVNGQRVDIVLDCRGMDLSATEAGKRLVPTSGQTVLLHAPEGTRFDGIVGNPGSEVSYNVIPWAKVDDEIVEILGLEGRLDPRSGGTLVLVGATKHLQDYNWDPQRWIVPALIEGAAQLDPRVRDWPPVLVRKGMRAKLPEGILDRTTLYGETQVRSMAGWAGAAYCGSWAYAEDVIEQIATNATSFSRAWT